ncbi:MAG: Eco57I restriction-modification methylase domain-containing protein [Promethearchaeota archaeon]
MINNHTFFFKRFENFFIELVNNVNGNIDQYNKSKIVQNLFDRIIFSYFLCDNNLIKVNGSSISGKKFFSNEIMNNGSFLKNFNNFFSYFGDPLKRDITINDYHIIYPYFKGNLFSLNDIERNLKINFNKQDWMKLFNFLNEFNWIIDEDKFKIKNLSYSNKIITPDILGYLHERLISRGLKKSKGVFYTPPEISDYICKRTIYSFLLNKLGFRGDEVFQIYEIFHEEGNENIIKEILKTLNKIKILDPSCGTGVFLIKVAKIIFNLITFFNSKLRISREDYDIKHEIAINNLYGIDINSNTIKITKLRLILWLLSSHSIEEKKIVLPNLEFNIISGNSLVGWNREKFLDEPLIILNEEIESLINKLVNLVNPERATLILKIFSKLTTINFTEQIKAYHELKNIYIEDSNEDAIILKQVLAIIRENFIKFINKKFANVIQLELKEINYNFGKDEILRHQLFHWNFEFEPILRDGGFDIIIGNPPYVFTRGMKFGRFERKFLKARYLKNYQPLTKGKAIQSGKLNAFSLFLIRSIELLKIEGKLGYIIPNTLLRTSTNDIIRQHILDHTHIEEIVDLGRSIFKDVTTSTIIIVLKKVNERVKEKSSIKHAIRNLLNQEYLKHEINQERFLDNVICCYNIHVNDQFEQIFNKMKCDTFELGDITSEILEGLVTRKKDDLFTKDSGNLSAKKLLRGKNIDRYKINWPDGQYIIYDRSRLHRARAKHVHEAPEKLLMQRIGGGIYPLRVTYDDEQHYFFASVNAIILNNPPLIENVAYDIKYILAILNSKLINGFYLLNYSNRSEFTVNITKSFIETIPIKKVDKEVQKNVSIVVDFLLFLNKFHPNEIEIIDFYDRYILDNLIYEIYFDSEFDTNLNKSIAPHLKQTQNIIKNRHNLKTIKNNLENMKVDLLLQEQIRRMNNNSITIMINNLFKERSDNLLS